MTPQRKTLVLFAVVAYIASIPFSAVLWGVEAGAWLLLAALAPCAITVGWVKILFLSPRLRTVPALLRGCFVGLLSYISFALLAAVYLSFESYRPFSGLRELFSFALISGTFLFGLPLTVVGGITGLAAEKLFHT